jgi:alkylation response protein AidB-like acyl-CoA dehydrogenase
MLTDMVHRYAERTLRQVYREAEEAHEMPPEVIEQGWELGLLPASLPEEYGGFGEYSALNGALIAEELGYGDMAASLALLAPNLVATPIYLCGTEEQKQTYLPMFTDVEMPKAASAFLEPVILFDPYHLRATARREGDVYILNGEKAMVINAPETELFLIYAHDEEADSTQAFLVPADAAGLSVGEREKWMGFNALKTYRLSLEDVRVPAQNRLGRDAGIDVQRILNSSRIALSALGVGLARAAYEYAREYAKERVAFGEPIAHRQSIAFMLAEMAIDIDATRLMVWEAAWKLDKGQNATHDAYLAARYAADVSLKVTDGAVQVLGGHGYIREHPVELWLRNARSLSTLLGVVTV